MLITNFHVFLKFQTEDISISKWFSKINIAHSKTDGSDDLFNFYLFHSFKCHRRKLYWNGSITTRKARDPYTTLAKRKAIVNLQIAIKVAK